MKKDASASGTNNNPDADEHAGTKSKDYGDFDKKFQVLLESQVIMVMMMMMMVVVVIIMTMTMFMMTMVMIL
jgi:hypothetical protein